MNSNRLLQISLFIDHNDAVIDVGCDHALLDIYLVENNICKKVLASDISENALNQGIANIKKHELEFDIPTIISDGLTNIETSLYNTVVLSGMGAHTIMHILHNKKKLKTINKIIISSNNNYDLVRRKLNKLGYYLIDEKVVNDKEHYYPIMKFVKKHKRNHFREIKYGLLKISNVPYYEFVVKHNKELKPLIKKDLIKKFKIMLETHYYQRYIKKITGKKLK